ncbi:glycosyltransferase involved in cell wall biosynthesis [Cryobacterium psychrotolerans]|nr:glycosyltransferase involved in cell wall biosynthesis [Cryobacterium psychrotolerans]
MEAMTLRAASKVVVIHERFAIYARESLGVEAQRIQVVRNWTHLASAPDRDVAAVRSGFGWDADETVVLHAGNMGAKQGLENVIAAARLCDDANLPIRFVLLGDGNQREHLELIGSGVKRLQFIDPVADSDFQAVLASADILLINEKPGVSGMSVPSKLTSYFDSGRAVVAATGPDGITAAELQAADGGFVVESGDPGALVTVCLNLREHPEKAEAFGNNGRQFRRDVLGEERAIAGFANMLEDVATKKAR